MTDDQGYPPAARIGAVLGLAAVAAVAFILADVASGGKLTGGCGCEAEEGAAEDERSDG